METRKKMCAKYNIGIETKRLLTVEEGAAYFGIGVQSMKRFFAEPENKKYTAYVGTKQMIKRVPLERYFDSEEFSVL